MRNSTKAIAGVVVIVGVIAAFIGIVGWSAARTEAIDARPLGPQHFVSHGLDITLTPQSRARGLLGGMVIPVVVTVANNTLKTISIPYGGAGLDEQFRGHHGDCESIPVRFLDIPSDFTAQTIKPGVRVRFELDQATDAISQKCSFHLGGTFVSERLTTG